MSNSFGKIDNVYELVESRADQEVVQEFVVKLEQEFVNAAIAHIQRNEYDLAIREFFHALLLPGRATVREMLLRRTLRAAEHLILNGDGLKHVECLSHP